MVITILIVSISTIKIDRVLNIFIKKKIFIKNIGDGGNPNKNKNRTVFTKECLDICNRSNLFLSIRNRKIIINVYKNKYNRNNFLLSVIIIRSSILCVIEL